MKKTTLFLATGACVICFSAWGKLSFADDPVVQAVRSVTAASEKLAHSTRPSTPPCESPTRSISFCGLSIPGEPLDKVHAITDEQSACVSGNSVILFDKRPFSQGGTKTAHKATIRTLPVDESTSCSYGKVFLKSKPGFKTYLDQEMMVRRELEAKKVKADFLPEMESACGGIAMPEYTPLLTYLERNPEKKLEMIKSMALLMEELHFKGFSVNDFKPDNLMVSADGKLKIIDLADIDWVGQKSRETLIAFSPLYSSPVDTKSTSTEYSPDTMGDSFAVPGEKSDSSTTAAILASRQKEDTYSLSMSILEVSERKKVHAAFSKCSPVGNKFLPTAISSCVLKEVSAMDAGDSCLVKVAKAGLNPDLGKRVTGKDLFASVKGCMPIPSASVHPPIKRTAPRRSPTL